MCAIAGILDFYAEGPPRLAEVRGMISRLRHRGPDDAGFYQKGPCVLGAARLAQIDAKSGTQPMTSPDGRWTLVFNGEIHNHPELRAELSAEWSFRTRSDTEVLLAALVKWRVGALSRLNGMFSFFLWDAQEQCGLAARDRLGVKPFVWMPLPRGCLAFASEAKALLQLLPGAPVVNECAVLEHLVAPCFSGVREPMFEGMRHLAPGRWLRVNKNGIQEGEWWSYDLHRGTRDDDELIHAIREALPCAVERTLNVDEPAVVMLSGGLDSTLLTALARRSGVNKAYTIAFEGQADFDYARALMVKSDDVPYATRAAREIGIEHRLVPVSRETLAEDMRVIALQNDALPAWEQELAQHHLGRAIAADGHRAVLVGDAADETHFGYGFLLDEASTSHPREFLRRFGHIPLTPAMAERARSIPDDLADFMWKARHSLEGRAERLRGITHLITRQWLPRLLHNGDIHLMAHGVEARVPFADAELLELAVQAHPLRALRGGVEKCILREAVSGLMPEEARLRRKSSLSKDDGSAAVLQSEAAKALDASPDFLGHWLELAALRRLCSPQHELAEMERALLFRVICLHHWAAAYHVRLP